MAIKKKPVKPAKKAQPKKAAKPAAKKVVAKKVSAVKPVKKDTSKKHVTVTKKTTVSTGKPAHSKTTTPKKTVPAASKKPATPPKKPAIATHPAKPHTVVAPVQPAPKPVVPLAKVPGKADDKKNVFKQQVLNTSPVTVKPDFKKHVAQPSAKTGKLVIPEIKTKTVRKYEPEFTKSVLDIHQQDQTGPTMRYSDTELSEFKDLISKKMDSAKKELAYLQGLITRRDEMGGDETDNRYMTMEDGSMSMEREQLSQMASRQITFIDHLEKAMMRIENKTYGICRVTGKLIDKARLKAVPHATLSIEAKQTMNK